MNCLSKKVVHCLGGGLLRTACFSRQEGPGVASAQPDTSPPRGRIEETAPGISARRSCPTRAVLPRGSLPTLPKMMDGAGQVGRAYSSIIPDANACTRGRAPPKSTICHVEPQENTPRELEASLVAWAHRDQTGYLTALNRTLAEPWQYETVIPDQRSTLSS